MSAWAFFVDVVEMVVMTLLVLAIGRAAIERGRINGEWARLERELSRKVSQSIDRYMAAATGCA